MPKQKLENRACDAKFLRALHRQVLRGITPAEPITQEQAAAARNYLTREVLYGSSPRLATYLG